jgi:hypothetical protein
MRKGRLTAFAAALVCLASAALAGATPYGADTRVTIGSQASPFSQNKQN